MKILNSLKKGHKNLLLLLLAGLILRFISLNQSLWLDESTTAQVVKTYSFSDILTKFSPTDFHPPLFYWIEKLWTSIFGYSEISLRFPSIIFSLLTGYVIYFLVKKMRNEQTAFWASAFFLLNPLIIYYSQEARMYMMVTFFLMVALYYFTQLLNVIPAKAGIQKKKMDPRSGSGMTIVLLNLFIFLSFATFYGSVFLIASFYLYLLHKRKYRLLFQTLLGFALSALILSPLLLKQLTHSHQALAAVVNWRQVLGTANLKNLLLIPLKFAFGRISFYPKIIYYAVAGLWTAFVFWFVFGSLRHSGAKAIESQKRDPIGRPSLQDDRNMFFFLFLTPLLFGFFFSFTTPLLQYFRFLYLIALMSILLVFGATKQWQRVSILAGFVLLSLIYLLNSNFHREDWKSLAHDLSEKTTVYMIESSSDSLKYYKNDIQVIDIRQDNKIHGQLITVIPYTTDIYGFDYRKALTEKGYVLFSQKAFRGVTLEHWRKNPSYASTLH